MAKRRPHIGFTAQNRREIQSFVFVRTDSIVRVTYTVPMASKPCQRMLLTVGLIALSAHAQEASDAQEEDKDQLTIEFSKTITLEKRVGGCQANLQMEYWQKGHIAEVQSTLTNPDCAASSGHYTISVRYRNDDGEMHSDEYQETWERSDGEPVTATKHYEIGDDVDLIRVRSRRLSCSCADE